MPRHPPLSRRSNAWFVALHGADSKVPFPCPEIELTLAEIYQGLD